MSDIDLKWLIIPAMPFVLLGLLRLIFFAAGAQWSEPGIAAVLCFVVGLVVGGAFAIAMHEGGIRWRVTIGKGKTDE